MEQNPTKKCPYCAEDILEDAKKCKHCGSDLPEPGPQRRKPGSIEKLLIWGVGIVVFIAFFMAVWFLPFFIIGGWLLWKKVAPGRNRKIAMTALVIAFIVATGVHDHYYGPPKVAIASPEAGTTVNASTTVVTGSVSSNADLVTINGIEAKIDGESFSATVPLPDESNELVAIATNSGEQSKSSPVTIRREFTPEERAARDHELEQQRQAVAAEEAKWTSSKAGKLCTAHPDWSRGECKDVADGKIWVGMTTDMLVALRGRPNSSNPSNYGSGTRYQYCWTGYTPSCFYDNNSDGVIDAYN